jgi:hypothetical protein
MCLPLIPGLPGPFTFRTTEPTSGVRKRPLGGEAGDAPGGAKPGRGAQYTRSQEKSEIYASSASGRLLGSKPGAVAASPSHNPLGSNMDPWAAHAGSADAWAVPVRLRNLGGHRAVGAKDETFGRLTEHGLDLGADLRCAAGGDHADAQDFVSVSA